jgi:hypothetical protein
MPWKAAYGRRLHQVGERLAEDVEALDARPGVLGIAGPQRDDGDDRPAVQLRRDVWRGRRGDHRQAAAERLGRVVHHASVGGDDLVGAVHGVEPHAAEHGRAQGHGAEGQLGHDAEVAAATAQRPEELGMLAVARGHLAPVGRDDPGGQEVVGSQAHDPLEPAAARPGREAHDADRRHARAGDGQAVLLGHRVELAPGHARAGGDRARGDAHVDGLQRPGVDHHAAVGDRVARGGVASPADGDGQAVRAGVRQRGGDVVGIGDLRDERGSPVDHGVVDAPQALVGRVVRADGGTAHGGPGDLGEGVCREHGAKLRPAHPGAHRGTPQGFPGRRRASSFRPPRSVSRRSAPAIPS